METETGAGPSIQDVVGTWKIDQAHTDVEFSAKHMMISTVRGRFNEFSGSFTIDPDPSKSTAELTIQAASISTNNPDRDTHLRSADFLDVEKHPTLTFKSTRVEVVSEEEGTFRLHGELMVKGVTRPVALDGRFEGLMEKDLFGSTRVSFSATTELNRKDWELTWNRALETGGVLVGDKVILHLDVTATRVS